MKVRSLKARLSIVLATMMMVFSSSTVAFAAETDTNAKAETSTMQFGEVLYADDDVAVFYGNPYEDEAATEAVESQATRSLRHDQVWVNANTSAYKTISIAASSSNPITYYTIKQETTSPLNRSYVSVFRPDGTICFVWQMSNYSQEIKDRVVGSNVLPNSAIAWTSGSLTLYWDVETGSSGARMNLWVW